MRKNVLAVGFAVAAITALTAPGAVAKHDPGFKTARPAQLVPIEPGVVVEPLLSVGDIVPGTTYQMSGIPDGLGAYQDAKHIHILMNHELGKSFPALPPGVDTRISKVSIDKKTHGVVGATYLFTGSEGFERFCSSTLEVINGVAYYFTGEETINTGHDGSSIVMNAETGEWTEAAHFGHIQHENVVPVERIKKFMVVTTDDDFRVGQPAYFMAYIADSFEAAVSGDPTKGSLYVWKATNPADTAFTMDRGETIPGEFVPITQAENLNSTTVKAAATAKGGFRFARLEDAATAQQHPGRVYFVDTGKVGEATLRGRLYRMDIEPSDPTKASVTLLADGDLGDNMVNPDNIDTSPHSVVIQEDREAPFRAIHNRVLVYDIKTGTFRAVARVNTTPPLPPGQWESSGVINAQTLLGNDWWLLDVQAHSTFAPQPGASPPGVQPTPNTGIGEDGQLLAVYIPNS